MVPSARLELAQLSPLPPQDSVSTNFTTTAAFGCLKYPRALTDFAVQTTLRVYPDLPLFPWGHSNYCAFYLTGIWAEPEAATAGADAGAAAGATTAAFSKTLPEVDGRRLPK